MQCTPHLYMSIETELARDFNYLHFSGYDQVFFSIEPHSGILLWNSGRMDRQTDTWKKTDRWKEGFSQISSKTQ